MTKTFMPAFKSLDELSDHQLNGLKWTVAHAYGGSEIYRNKFEGAGVHPDDIKSLVDIQRLPFTKADDLRDGYPFPLLSVPKSKVVRIHASSGTTGRKKVLCYTKKDIEDWTHFFARCYEMAELTEDDRIQIAVGYGIWTAGSGFQLGCEKFGAMAIPVGPGNVDMQCRFLVDLQATVLCSTASMALLMAEEIEKRNLRDKIALKKLIFGSERSSTAMRKRIKELMGVEDIFDIPGLTELYGPGTGLDCKKHEGIHYWADYYILEILDPETMKPVAEGEAGEMVVTTLTKEAAPLIRYRTGDLSRIISHPCSCGNILPMHDSILGRTDDMIIFRAVNIYPGQIDEILSNIPEISCEYQLVLDRKEDGRDYMKLRVECHEDADSSRRSEVQIKISRDIKKQIMVSCQVELVDYHSLPKESLITDNIKKGGLKDEKKNKYDYLWNSNRSIDCNHFYTGISYSRND
ncbi:MAG: phenylacetate--CoA ligase [Desulfobacula sp.]|uniref:phenylacetate--CoA ligase family protein n=1 Tax=Desulfobacula sp. TaxID=2593537 RepID=UPI0025BDF969|nr:phenylacetate--CoA ligase [Desulfobacula sp.]MCD4722817.1 phenylacetate--CoA ligase [Desulfobacula sp.]